MRLPLTELPQSLHNLAAPNGDVYTVTKCIGFGGSSLVYRAEKTSDKSIEKFIIKEVFPQIDGNEEAFIRVAKSANLKPSEKSIRGLSGKSYSLSDLSAILKNSVNNAKEEVSIIEKLKQYETKDENFPYLQGRVCSFPANETYYTIIEETPPLEALTNNFDLSTAIRFAQRILHPLKMLHKRGYLHLDIKPANLLCSPFGVEDNEAPILFPIDLNSAKAIKNIKVLTPNDITATLTYAAPEIRQAFYGNLCYEKITPHTDLYSVALTMLRFISWDLIDEFNNAIYELQTDEECLSEVLELFPTLKPQIAKKYGTNVKEALNDFFAKALSWESNKRFDGDCDKMREALNDVLKAIENKSAQEELIEEIKSEPLHKKVTRENAEIIRNLVEMPNHDELFLTRLRDYHKDNTVRPRLDAEIAFKDASKKLTTMLKIDGDSEPSSFDCAISRLEDEERKILLIYGAGGSGKTFMLLEQVHNAIEKNGKHFAYIPLNELTFFDKCKREIIKNPISTYLDDVIFGKRLDWKTQYAHTGTELLLYLDGFNEVSTELLPFLDGFLDKRTLVASEISTLSISYNLKIIVASRFEDTLAELLGFGLESSIQELDEPIIKEYLKNCGYNGKLPLPENLMDILKNPLMLTLFANTTQYNREDKKKIKNFCRWIDGDSISMSDSVILWNYLNCDVVKVKNSRDKTICEDKVLKWLCVRFFLPRLAFYMQSKTDSFLFTEDELEAQIDLTIKWLKHTKLTTDMEYDANSSYSHLQELLRANKLSKRDWRYHDLFNYIESLSKYEVYYYITNEIRSLFGGEKEKMKFFHQSLRDSLAAIHLINTLPIYGDHFPKEWRDISFAKNVYMLHHLSELSKALYDNKSLYDALNALRGEEKVISLDNHTLNNLLLLFRQPAQLSGDFSGFDFSRLDLRNCLLTEFTLSDDAGQGANFAGAYIGIETFKRSAHSKPITAIAVSDDGEKIATCGKDRVLLWNYPKRTVEREVFRYAELMGKYDEASNNAITFSKGDRCLIFTDAEILYEFDLNDSDTNNKPIPYKGAKTSIVSILSFVIDSGTEYYYACDLLQNLICWQKGNPIPIRISQCNVYGVHSVYAAAGHSILFQGNGISVINAGVDAIQKYLSTISFYGLYSLGENSTLFAIIHATQKITVYDAISGALQSIRVDFDSPNTEIEKISSSFGGQYLLAIGSDYSDYATEIVAFSKKNTSKNQVMYHSTPVFKYYKSGIVQYGSFEVYNTRFFLGLPTGKIYVGSFYQEDDRIYITTYLDNHAPWANDLALLLGDKCIVAYEDSSLREWNYKTGGMLFKYEDANGHRSSVISVAVANNSNLIASGDSDGRILLWDSESKVLIREIGDLSLFLTNELKLAGFANGISSIAFTNDDTHIIASAGSGLLSVFKISSGNIENEEQYLCQPISRENKHNASVYEILYYQIDGEDRIVSGDRLGHIIFWRLTNEKQLEVLRKVNDAHTSQRIHSFALSPDNKTVISYGEDETVVFWSTSDSNEINRITVDDESMFFANADSCCFSNDGSKIYLTGRKTDVSVPIVELDIESGNKRILFEMQDIVSRNGGVVRATESAIVSAGICGNVYSYYNEKLNHHMKAYEPVKSKLRFARGLAKARFESDEMRGTILGTSHINGMFKDWLEGKNGDKIIFNLIGLVDWNQNKSESIMEDWEKRIMSKNSDSESYLFGKDCVLTKLEDSSDKMHLIASSFVTITFTSLDVSHEAERILLEACLGFLYDGFPKEERHQLTLLDLLYMEQHVIDHASDLEVFCSVFKRKFGNHRAVALYEKEYLKTYGRDNNVVHSLVSRFKPLSIWYKMDKLPSLPNEIKPLAVSLVCNKPMGSCCPAAFTSVDTSQVIFLELALHYINSFKSEDRTIKMMKVLENDVSEAMAQFKASINSDIFDGLQNQLKPFLASKESKKLLSDANRVISKLITHL